MKKILITLLAALPFLSLPLQSIADKDKGKGPSARAYERANDNASFKRDDNKHRDRDDHEGMYDRESRDDNEIKSSDEKYKSRKNEKDNKDKKKQDDNS